MTGRLAAFVVVLLVAGGSSTVSADERHDPPNATGWWQTGAIALVTSAGLEEGELLVDGFGSDEASRQAVAALSFPVEPGSSLGPISIPIVSASLPAESVGVCAVTASFLSAAGGPSDDVPPHDCARSTTAKSDDRGHLVIADLSALADEEHVRILLVPTQPGRIVLDGAKATLSVTSTHQSAAPAPTSTAHEPEPPVGAAATSGGPIAPPAPEVAAPEDEAPPMTSAIASSPAASFPRFTPRPDDGGTRLLVALILTLALGAFTVLNRSGTARLRPSVLRWPARAEPHESPRQVRTGFNLRG